MQSALSFAPLRPVGFVNFHGAGRGGAAYFSTGRGRATIPAFHSTQVLPKHLTAFFISLLNLRESFDSKAEQRAVKRTKPKSGFESCRVEIYPNLPEHTIENEYICCRY